jgi:glycosyltransferase involved in cell wall biosynthesis
VSAPPLLDLHHLGNRQTGNESWARSLGAALFELDGPGAYDVAVTSTAPTTDLALLPARERVTVSGSSARRLALDLPSAMRRLGTPVVLVQYTVPVSRVPAVVMVHDLSFEDPRAAEWLPLGTRARYRASIRASVGRAAHVLTVSEYSRRDLVERYGLAPECVTLAPNAVDPRFAELVQATPEARDRRPTVLAVGNVLPRKNLGVVAQAVRLLRERGEDVVLRVVGTVPASGRAEAEAVRARLGTAVEMTGYVTQAQLAREMRSAHVLAFPSLFEGFGIPVLEAMSADLPVVVADRTSLPEVVGNAGLVVPAEDPAAWADVLHEVLNGAVGTRLAAAGRERLREFDWRTSAATVSRVLDSVGNP